MLGMLSVVAVARSLKEIETVCVPLAAVMVLGLFAWDMSKPLFCRWVKSWIVRRQRKTLGEIALPTRLDVPLFCVRAVGDEARRLLSFWRTIAEIPYVLWRAAVLIFKTAGSAVLALFIGTRVAWKAGANWDYLQNVYILTGLLVWPR